MRALIPIVGFCLVAFEAAHSRLGQLDRIESLRHSKCRACIARIRRALKEQSRRRDISRRQQLITALRAKSARSASESCASGAGASGFGRTATEADFGGIWLSTELAGAKTAPALCSGASLAAGTLAVLFSGRIRQHCDRRRSARASFTTRFGAAAEGGDTGAESPASESRGGGDVVSGNCAGASPLATAVCGWLDAHDST